MKRALIVAAIAVVLLAAALAVFAPASLVAPYVERTTQGSVAVTAVEGTLWRGRATLAAGPVQLPIAWTVAPLPLATGEARIELAPGDAMASVPRADIRATRDRLVVSGLAVAFPAAVLQPALQRGGGAQSGWTLAGDIAVAAPSLEWKPTGWSGGLDLDWRNAQLMPGGARSVALGDLSARLAAGGSRLAGPVVNRGGELDVRGDLALETNGRVAATLLLTPRRADDAELARALAAVGTAEGAGWRVSWPSKPR
jgi:hypothetical protein